jgi:Bacterial protein of unknown function (YtfJ_HI0045)
MMPYRGIMVAAVVATVVAGAPAWALPQLGAPLPAVTIDDVAAARARALPIGRPMLVMYEDREAQAQNLRAREVIGRINDLPQNRERFEFVAVADVGAWNWWPARRAVLSDLKDIAARNNTTVYADWHGALRKTWGLTQHRSALVLADAAGKVQFAAEGTLSQEQLQALLVALERLGCTTAEFAGATATGR